MTDRSYFAELRRGRLLWSATVDTIEKDRAWMGGRPSFLALTRSGAEAKAARWVQRRKTRDASTVYVDLP